MRLAIVNETVVSLMDTPSENSTKVDEVLYGWVVTILEENGDWIKIKTHYNYEGFSQKKFFITNQAQAHKWFGFEKYVINNKFADALQESRVEGKILATLTLGSYVHKVSECSDKQDWSSVTLANGETAYVRTNFLSKKAPDYETISEQEFRNNVVETAKLYLGGTQYRWGGKSPLGIDCSGLTSMSYMLNGAIIYRNSSIKAGFPVKKIDYKDVKKGDLIFFPGHIAMHIGDGDIIHSSPSVEGVGFNSLNPNHANFRQDLLNSILYAGSLFV